MAVPMLARELDTPSGHLLALPLNIVAMIVSYIDNRADVARLVRTCRIMRYMALPQLYNEVDLHSYPDIRYVDGLPEGLGSSSPFTTALNTLATRNVASLVHSLKLSGQVREDDLEQCARVGRVPDHSVIFSTLVRCIIDRMAMLTDFNWNLNIKLSRTVFEGLQGRDRLTSLSIRFPSTRTPRPTTILPPLPSLERLTLTHIDPLCYHDDVSELVAYSRKLNNLRMSWSPRMRTEGEPSVDLQSYFGRCLAARYKIKLRHLSLANLYTRSNIDLVEVIDSTVLESVTIFNCGERGFYTGGEGVPTVFLDIGWGRQEKVQRDNVTRLKTIRFDGYHSDIRSYFHDLFNLEYIYFVSATPSVPQRSRAPSSNITPSTNSGSPDRSPQDDTTNTSSPNVHADKDAPPSLRTRIKDSYLSHITTTCGANLKHLLLPVKWNITVEDIQILAGACPNITQLGLAIHPGRHRTRSKAVMYGFPKLFALRGLTENPTSPAGTASLCLDPMAPGVGLTLREAFDERLLRAMLANEVESMMNSVDEDSETEKDSYVKNAPQAHHHDSSTTTQQTPKLLHDKDHPPRLTYMAANGRAMRLSWQWTPAADTRYPHTLKRPFPSSNTDDPFSEHLLQTVVIDNHSSTAPTTPTPTATTASQSQPRPQAQASPATKDATNNATQDRRDLEFSAEYKKRAHYKVTITPVEQSVVEGLAIWRMDSLEV